MNFLKSLSLKFGYSNGEDKHTNLKIERNENSDGHELQVVLNVNDHNFVLEEVKYERPCTIVQDKNLLEQEQ